MKLYINITVYHVIYQSVKKPFCSEMYPFDYLTICLALHLTLKWLNTFSSTESFKKPEET